jgi:uncharacterized membrane protein (DUF106 family)
VLDSELEPWLVPNILDEEEGLLSAVNEALNELFEEEFTVLFIIIKINILNFYYIYRAITKIYLLNVNKYKNWFRLPSISSRILYKSLLDIVLSAGFPFKLTK